MDTKNVFYIKRYHMKIIMPWDYPAIIFKSFPTIKPPNVPTI